MPTGFKNSTDGSVGIAVDACRAARSGHVFLSVGKEGLSSIIETEVSFTFVLIGIKLISEFRETQMSTSFCAVDQRARITRLNTFVTAPKNSKRPA